MELQTSCNPSDKGARRAGQQRARAREVLEARYNTNLSMLIRVVFLTMALAQTDTYKDRQLNDVPKHDSKRILHN